MSLLEERSAQAPIREREDAPPTDVDGHVRFPYIDSLRAIAALAVFSAHLAYRAQSDIAKGVVLRLDVSIAVFLVISGFLLYRPFVAARLGERPPVSYRRFAWSRFMRLFPLLWIVLTVVGLWFAIEVLFSADGLLYYTVTQIYRPDIVLIDGIGQTWTLAVEAGFYVFLPLWAWAFTRVPVRGRRSGLWAEVVAVVALMAAAVLFKQLVVFGTPFESGAFARWGLLQYLDMFALGMGLAVASVALGSRPLPRWARALDRFPGIAWAVAGIALWIAVTQVDASRPLPGVLTPPPNMLETLLYWVFAVGLIVPATFGDQRRGLVRRLLASRALLWLGAASYSFYLWHQAVLRQLAEWDVGGVWLGVLGLAGSLALAALTWRLVEVPTLRMKRLPPDRTGLARFSAALGAFAGAVLVGFGILGPASVFVGLTFVVAGVVVAVLALLAARSAGRVLAVLGAAMAVLALVDLVVTEPGIGAPPERDRTAHLTLTYDGRALELWVDGRRQASRKVSGVPDTGVPVVEIGAFAGGAAWRGEIRDVALYDRALAPGVVREHHRIGRLTPGAYEAAVRATPGLRARWPLGGRSGTFTAQTRPAVFDLPRVGRAFTVEAWAKRPEADENGHGAVVSRPGAFDLQTDLLGRWSASVTIGGQEQRITAAQNARGLADEPLTTTPPKPSPDPALIAFLCGVLALFAGLGCALPRAAPPAPNL